MTTLDHVPFGNMEFAQNPEPRCPCLLLLDTSESMRGDKIRELNAGLVEFALQLRADPMASKRVEVAVVTFGPVNVVQPFVTADSFVAPELRASGNTPIGAAIVRAADLIAQRKRSYRENGIGYYRPWIFMISDGEPTDDVRRAQDVIKQSERAKSFMFYSVGVAGANMDALARISVRQPLRLKGLAFDKLFVWLSHSLSTVSRSQTSDTPALANPASPSGWAMVD
jgi:uncharacterized protein YegL